MMLYFYYLLIYSPLWLRCAAPREMSGIQSESCLWPPSDSSPLALLKGLGVTSIQQLLREGIFRTVKISFQEDHRLRHALATAVDEFVLRPSSLRGSFFGQVMDMCKGIVQGHILCSLFSPPLCDDGVAHQVSRYTITSPLLSVQILLVLIFCLPSLCIKDAE